MSNGPKAGKKEERKDNLLRQQEEEEEDEKDVDSLLSSAPMRERSRSRSKVSSRGLETPRRKECPSREQDSNAGLPFFARAMQRI